MLSLGRDTLLAKVDTDSQRLPSGTMVHSNDHPDDRWLLGICYGRTGSSWIGVAIWFSVGPKNFHLLTIFSDLGVPYS